MISKIIHCADLHIRNFQRQDEYIEQLGKFADKCREIAEPYQKDEVRILISGDIANSKNEISNELMVLTSFFIRQLEDIAPVIIIAGNHDLVLNNLDRTDTLTGIFRTADFKNSKYLDMMLDYKSGCILDDNVIWALYSICDDYLKPDIESAKEESPDAKVIGLYHGTVVGASLNNGTVFNEGLDKDDFKECDCVMAGHIHKRQVLKRGKTPIVYPGSLIQQTFGETISKHGFAVWDIPSMKYEFIDIESDYNLYDIEINKIDDLDNDDERLLNE